MTKEVEYEDIKDNKKYIVQVVCGECGKVLNETKRMKGSELKDDYSRLIISANLVTSRCPKGCFTPYRDINTNIDEKIIEI